MVEVGTIEELNVKPGDVLAWHKAAPGYEWQDNNFTGVDDWVAREDGGIFSKSADDGFDSSCLHLFRIVYRASDETHSSQEGEPKLWRDMTDAEKGALLLAHHEGKEIEYYACFSGWRKEIGFDPKIYSDLKYRVKPEPVRETVTLMIDDEGMGGPRAIGTINLIDGKPDPDSIKMKEL